MRLGKRMKEILNVLQKTKEPLTLSEIVVRIYDEEKNLQRWRGTRINKIGTAVAKTAMHWDSVSFSRIKSKTGKDYHPMTYVDVLYALYSRSLKKLWEYDLVRCVDHWKANRKRWILSPNVKKPFINV